MKTSTYKITYTRAGQKETIEVDSNTVVDEKAATDFLRKNLLPGHVIVNLSGQPVSFSASRGLLEGNGIFFEKIEVLE